MDLRVLEGAGAVLAQAHPQQLAIREASAADRAALVRLAQRDSAEIPAGELLVGEIDGVIAAAVDVEDGRTIADPFRATSDLVALLNTRAGQLRGARGRPLRLVASSAQPSGWRKVGLREA